MRLPSFITSIINSARNEALRLYHQEAERRKALLEAITDATWTVDPDGRLVTEEDAAGFMQITGCDFETCKGFGWGQCLHPEDHDRIQDEWKRVSKGRKGGAFEFRVMHPVKGVRYLSGRTVPIFEPDGQLKEWANAYADRTEEFSIRESLSEALRTANAANEAKTYFLAMMSHELRTPLAAIMGYTEIMAMGVHGPVTEEQGKDYARILSSSEHLLNLITGVLEYSKLESGTLRMRSERVSMNAVVQYVIEMLETQIAEKRINVVVENCEDCDTWGDQDRLKQIIINLISNALKFTPSKGDIRIKIHAKGSKLNVEITDSGIGIPPHALPSIFDPFTQVETGTTRKYGGVGLGLSISRQFARSMGGDVGCLESTAGVGSTFILVMPRYRETE